MNGVVKRVFHQKGFGFITGEDGVERFFHISGCEKFGHIHDGSKVSFDHVESNKPDKGPRANNVKVF